MSRKKKIRTKEEIKKQISITVRNIKKKYKEVYKKADRERKKLSRKILK